MLRYTMVLLLATGHLWGQSPVSNAENDPCLIKQGLRIGTAMKEIHARYPDLIANTEMFDPATMDSSECDLWYRYLPSTQIIPDRPDSVTLFLSVGKENELQRVDVHFRFFNVPDDLEDWRLILKLQANGYSCIPDDWARSPLKSGSRSTGKSRSTFNYFRDKNPRTGKTTVLLILGFYSLKE